MFEICLLTFLPLAAKWHLDEIYHINFVEHVLSFFHQNTWKAVELIGCNCYTNMVIGTKFIVTFVGWQSHRFLFTICEIVSICNYLLLSVRLIMKKWSTLLQLQICSVSLRWRQKKILYSMGLIVSNVVEIQKNSRDIRQEWHWLYQRLSRIACQEQENWKNDWWNETTGFWKLSLTEGNVSLADRC